MPTATNNFRQIYDGEETPCGKRRSAEDDLIVITGQGGFIALALCFREKNSPTHSVL